MEQRPATTRNLGAFPLPRRPTNTTDRPGPRPEGVFRPLEPEQWAAVAAGLRRLEQQSDTSR